MAVSNEIIHAINLFSQFIYKCYCEHIYKSIVKKVLSCVGQRRKQSGLLCIILRSLCKSELSDMMSL